MYDSAYRNQASVAGDIKRLASRLLMGGAYLIIGWLLYLRFRDPVYQYVLPAPYWLKGEVSTALGPLPYVAPSFLHTAAFSIVTAAWFRDSRRVWLASCAFWLAVNAVLELLQLLHDPNPSRLANPRLSWAMRYVTQGVFDPLDLAAAAFGAFVAYQSLKWTARIGHGNW